MATSKSDALCGECGAGNPMYQFGKVGGRPSFYLCGQCADDLMLFTDEIADDSSEFPEETHDDLPPDDPADYNDLTEWR